MKISRLTITLIALGTLAVFAAGFLTGGTYATARAIQADNKASIIYFSGIHHALIQQDYSRAAAITNSAVDSHVAVLRSLSSSSWLARTCYTVPWTQEQQSLATSSSLFSARRAYAAQPEQLQTDTRIFLGL